MKAKLILIEDDAVQLKLLGKIIASYFPEIEIVGSFLNASDALKYIQKNKCDIVISDIKLPGMTGLELAEICVNHYPSIKFILISAYREFKYAKEAIRLNVSDYILKPVNPKLLCESLSKISLSEQPGNFINEKIALNRSMFFSKLMAESKMPAEAIRENLSFLEMPLNVEGCVAFFFKIDLNEYSSYILNTWRHEKDMLIKAIINIIATSADNDDYTVVISSKYDCVKCLYLTDADEEVFSDYTTNLTKNLKSILNLDSTVTLLKSFKGLISLSEYTLAESYFSDLIEKTFASTDELPDCDETIVKFTEFFKNYKNDMATLKSFCSIAEKYALNNIGIKNINDYEIPLYNYETFTAYEEIENYISELLKKMFVFLSQKNYDEIITKATNYIRRNLKNDITLENVAAHVSQSSSYFSKYFKKVTGENFVKYVNRIRMQTAMELLKRERNIKIISVMYEIGYDNSATFFRNFKTFTGCTPMEYHEKFFKDGSVEL